MYNILFLIYITYFFIMSINLIHNNIEKDEIFELYCETISTTIQLLDKYNELLSGRKCECMSNLLDKQEKLLLIESIYKKKLEMNKLNIYKLENFVESIYIYKLKKTILLLNIIDEINVNKP